MARFSSVRKFVRNEKGATAIEYGLIAALVSVAIVGALGQLSGGLSGAFEYIATQLTNAAPAAP